MNKSEKKIRVRFAPSPTGYLHVGGLRTALYNYLFAKKNGGDFILRIEDTDQKRKVKNGVTALLITLNNFMNWDEGPIWDGDSRSDGTIDLDQDIKSKGDFGSYIQSQRLDIYKKYVEKLLKDGKAYYCFCTEERLKEMREKQIKKKEAPMYDRSCLNLSAEEVKDNLDKKIPYVIRLRVPENEVIEFKDLIRGKVSFDSNNIDDQVLLKADGFPTYHLANVVDDHLMGITHVIRGEEWLPSTPKHILLYRAFDWKEPSFAHIPLLLNPDKTKLSKRQGDVAVEDYIQKGYLKEAIINFVALLGWNPGEGSTQEIFSIDELIDKFELKKVHKAGAIFDIKKLDWLNAQYIKKMSVEEIFEKYGDDIKKKPLYAEIEEFSKEHNFNEDEFLKKIITVEHDRLSKISDIGDEVKFLFRKTIKYNKELLRWKNMDDKELKKSLEISLNCISQIKEEKFNFNEPNILSSAIDSNLLVLGIKKQNMKPGELYWPLRVALTGEKKSPPPGEVAWVLGKKESLKRIVKALKML